MFTLAKMTDFARFPAAERQSAPGPWSPVLAGQNATGQPMLAGQNGNGNDDRRGGDNGRTTTNVVVKPRPKVKKPSMYKVLMLNDDYTPIKFVVHVLERYFGKTTEEATRIMLHVHQKGVGVCGVFTFEVAETKVNQTMELARKNQHPLQCTLEKE